jgi:uncharacterized protein (TIGR04255 family)
MGEKLKKPPIVEALCEFRFDASSPWDWTIPGQVFDKIKDEFSVRAEVRQLGVHIPPGMGVPAWSQGPGRVQLKRPDGSAMVQVGPNILAVNHLRPYPQWEVFRRLILRIFDTYGELANPKSLIRIGLRYINQIPWPNLAFEIGDLITVSPPLSGSLDRPLTGFFQRYELIHENPKGILVHQTGIQKQNEHQYIMVDLDFGSHDVEYLGSPEAVATWLDAAHERVLEAFVGSLNPNLYEKMKRGEE